MQDANRNGTARMVKYPIVVLGAGPAGADYIKNLQRDHRLDVIGFTDLDMARCDEVERTTGVLWYESFGDLLARSPERPKAAIVATGNASHSSLSIECLEAGLHVFCEKPMAMSSEDALEMLEAEARSGRYLQIGFEYRYGTLTGRLTELLESGFFGTLKHLTITDSRGHWLTDPETNPLDAPKLDPKRIGGPIIHCGIHQLDLLRHWGGEIDSLQAFVSPRSMPWYPKYCPDQCSIMVKFESGASGAIHLYHGIAPTWYHGMPSWVPEYRKVPGHLLDVTLSGNQACALANIYSEDLHLAKYDEDIRDTVYLRTESLGHQHRDASHHNMTKMALDFCLRMRDGQGPLHAAADSFRTTQLGFLAQKAVDEAIESGWSSRVLQPERGDSAEEASFSLNRQEP